MKKVNYRIKSVVWLYPGAAAWHFVGIDKKNSAQIKKDFGKNNRGFGSIRVEVTIGETKWRTSIFPDKRSDTYLLPLKAEVRKLEGISNGDKIAFNIKII